MIKNGNNAFAVTKDGNQSIANRPSIKIMDFRPKKSISFMIYIRTFLELLNEFIKKMMTDFSS